MSWSAIPRPLKILFWSRLLQAFAFGLSFPFLPIYFGHQGISMGSIGLIMAGSLTCSALGNLVGGQVTDDLGAKATILFSLKWRTLLIMAIAASIASDAPAALTAAIVFINTFIMQFLHPSSDTYIAERTSMGERAAVFSWVRVAINAGWALGPAIGGLLAQSLGFESMFAATAVLTMLNYFQIKKYLPQDKIRLKQPGFDHQEATSFSIKAWKASLRHWPWRVFMAVSFLAAVAHGQLFNMLGLYLSRFHNVSEASVGALFAWNGFLVVILQTVTARLAAQVRLHRVSALGLGFYSLGYFMIAYLVGLPWYFAAITVFTIGEVIHSPASLALTANFAGHYGGDARQGFYFGFAQFVSVLGGLASSVTTGYLLEHMGHFDPSMVWVLIAVVAVMASFGFQFLGRFVPKKEILGIAGPFILNND
ncbi:MAG: MFS transporter [Elusimicrobia bacterium]|nr:MFS transporter [Elusimicrobiota bacterium]